MQIEFITSNNWSTEDLEIESTSDTIISHVRSIYPKGINMYVGYESGKVYDVWLDKEVD